MHALFSFLVFLFRSYLCIVCLYVFLASLCFFSPLFFCLPLFDTSSFVFLLCLSTNRLLLRLSFLPRFVFFASFVLSPFCICFLSPFFCSAPPSFPSRLFPLSLSGILFPFCLLSSAILSNISPFPPFCFPLSFVHSFSSFCFFLFSCLVSSSSLFASFSVFSCLSSSLLFLFLSTFFLLPFGFMLACSLRLSLRLTLQVIDCQSPGQGWFHVHRLEDQRGESSPYGLLWFFGPLSEEAQE